VEDAVKVGDEVKVKVLGVDPEKKRISLSIRQAIEPEPVAEEVPAEAPAADEYEVVATEDSVSEKFAQAEEAAAEEVKEAVEEAAADAAEAVEGAVAEAAEAVQEIME
jgi:predicted RNA-binding protein with RPS1 domain